MKLLKLSFSLFLLCFSSIAYASRTDSFSISHTEIHLAVRNFSAKTIKGHASHRIKFKVPTSHITLDLSGMTVDSVLTGTMHLGYSRATDKLGVTLDKLYQAGDSIQLDVYYGGVPAADPGGWGGFYFTGDYAFNLGVGFQVNPHSYGRAWFPCVDEFTMKSRYEFYIETDTNYTAACNGELSSVQTIGNSKLWHYAEAWPMSAYLASVSVSRYTILKSNCHGIQRDFPIWIYCLPSDSNRVKTSFTNLPKAIAAFEKAFGPQVYSKVGYNLVPFSAGAMEHPGNITYPAIYADGTLNYETLFAHELSHHWWGDNVTCRDAGDMWLNEGWASYCEKLFVQQVYGEKAYKAEVLANHLLSLRLAHITDSFPMSLVGVPQNHTYGTHVYKKGADVVHSLRGVVGDTVFFRACKAYQQMYRAGNTSSNDLMHAFEQNGAGSLATSFFNNWVDEKGSPHVIISKQVHSGNGPYNLKFYTQQKPRFTGKLYTNMPVEVFFFKDRMTYEKRTILINGQADSFSFDFSFRPVFVCLDYDEKLSDAITDRTLVSGSTGTFDLPETFCKVILRNKRDTALVRVEHHWVGPELYKTKAPYMSDYRYYTLDGIWDDSLAMDLELPYDGRKQENTATGYLDHTLIFTTEDSLTLLYRGFPGDYWRVWPDLQFTNGGKFDKSGKVLVKNARKGDYVFAMYDQSLAIPRVSGEKAMTENTWTVSPSPAGNLVTINFMIPDLLLETSYVLITDQLGNQVDLIERKDGMDSIILDTSSWAGGLYIVSYYGKTFRHTARLLISR